MKHSLFCSSAAAVALAILSAPAARAEGVPLAWGRNYSGQLGDGTTIDRTAPVSVVGLSDVKQVASGSQHTLALKNDGTVWGWGNNWEGELGDGTTTNRLTPVKTTVLSGITAIASGWNHGLALRNDGTVWAWGDNSDGALGDGTTINRAAPAQVPGLTNVIAIAGGAFHSMALRSDGTLLSWGFNQAGQLGNGYADYNPHPVPSQVVGLTNVVAIRSGPYHSVAIRNDGTLWAWGSNSTGQIGDGTTADAYVPLHVPGLSGVVAADGGLYFSVALLSNGTVWTWGWNAAGTLGDGTHSDTSRLVPGQVPGLSGVVAIGAGHSHCMALRNDGTVWGWGQNRYGELADGTTTERDSPVQAIGISGIGSLNCGTDQGFALAGTSNTPPVANDQSVATPQDKAVAITLTATDAQDDSVTYTVKSLPTHGTLSGAAPNLTYTPATSYTGNDSFTFTANDGHADSNVATVSISVRQTPRFTAASVHGPLGTKVTLSASLIDSKFGTGIAGRSIQFAVDGVNTGSPVTTASTGKAVLSYLIPDGTSLGTHTIKAKFSGDTNYAPVTATGTLTVDPPAVLKVTLSPASVTGGKSSTGTVTMTGTVTADTAVTLGSSSTLAHVPASVTVLSGASTATFSITTEAVAANTGVSISATRGTVTKSASLTLRPIGVSAVSCTPNPVTGSLTTAGKVTLELPAAPAGISVSLTSSNPTLAQIVDGSGNPISTITVASGSQTGSFFVHTGGVNAAASVTVKAVANGVAKSVTLKITPIGVAALTLNPSTVQGGSGSTATIKLTAPATSAGLTVSLSSSTGLTAWFADGAGSRLNSITIPAGQLSVQVPVKTASVTAATTVSLKAGADGISKTVVLTINP